MNAGDNALVSDVLPGSLELAMKRARPAIDTDAQPNGSYGLAQAATIRAGNAADSNRALCTAGQTSALRHGQDNSLTDRPLFQNQIVGDPQHLGFGRIAVGDKGAVEPAA